MFAKMVTMMAKYYNHISSTVKVHYARTATQTVCVFDKTGKCHSFLTLFHREERFPPSVHPVIIEGCRVKPVKLHFMKAEEIV